MEARPKLRPVSGPPLCLTRVPSAHSLTQHKSGNERSEKGPGRPSQGLAPTGYLTQPPFLPRGRHQRERLLCFLTFTAKTEGSETPNPCTAWKQTTADTLSLGWPDPEGQRPMWGRHQCTAPRSLSPGVGKEPPLGRTAILIPLLLEN